MSETKHKRRGRKSKLTPEVVERVRQAMRAGAYLKDAFAFAGIGQTTGFDWLSEFDDSADPVREDFESDDDFERASARFTLLGEFSEAVQNAEASSKVAALANIRQAAQNGSWQADAWYLERRYPHEFGRRVQEITGERGGPVRFHVDRESVETLLRDPAMTAEAQERALFRTLSSPDGSQNGGT
jgi:hypothetical protein